MDGLGDTIRKLRSELGVALQGQAPGSSPGQGAASRLTAVEGFGSNPGRLGMRLFVPAGIGPRAPLVVALHGCTQTADAYDAGGGWSDLAGRHGFVVLFPEQTTSNNPNRCFNWFDGAATMRDSGEAHSIRQMIEHTVAAHDIDRRRIFVTGLSAGGAMASSLLAAYPDVFAAGAIIAGLPHGSAGNMSEALQVMSSGRPYSAEQWGDKVRSASPHRGPWPRVAIWHGSRDHIVSPANAQASIRQWTNVHGVSETADDDQARGNHRVRVWRDSSGRDVVQAHDVEGMGHGVPQALSSQAAPGSAMPFHFDVGIASTASILAFFDVADPATAATARRVDPAVVDAPMSDVGPPSRPGVEQPDGVFEVLRNAGVLGPTRSGRRRHPPLSPEVHGVIQAALRAAGLLKKK